MPQAGATAKFHLICSDQPRNGKTLLARLLIDYLILSERTPLIFDASPAAAGLSSYFPIRRHQIDLSATLDQMTLFDQALKQPLRHSVLDLPSHLLEDFFGLVHQLGFADTAKAEGLGIIIYFIIDRTMESLHTARKMRNGNRIGRFIAVRNKAFLPGPLDHWAEAVYEDVAQQGQVIIPALDANILARIEKPSFSFSLFAEEASPWLVPGREAVRSFLADVYAQFDALGLFPEFAEAKK